MIRIELHGFGGERKDLKLKIFDLFKGKPYYKEIRVETCFTEVKNGENSDQPYIHLIIPRSERVPSGEIIGILRTLNFAVDYMESVVFWPFDESEPD
jgi:hypothetical protein